MTRLTTEDGLADNNVRTVLQDRTGFLWLVTRRGVLQRYDGHSFLEYRALAPDAPPEFSRDVQLLVRDQDGWIWVSAANRLFQIDSTDQPRRIVVLDSAATTMVADSGRLWFIAGGTLQWIDAAAPSPVPTVVGARGEWVEASLATGRSGRMWLALARENGTTLVHLNPRTGERKVFRIAGFGPTLGVAQGTSGHVWLTSPRGVVSLDPESGASRFVATFRGKPTTAFTTDAHGSLLAATDEALFRIGPTGTVDEQLTSPEVFGRTALPNALVADRDGGVWLATTTAGLVRLHTSQPAFVHYARNGSPPLKVGSDFVMALHERADGTLWVGTLRGGAYRVSPEWRTVRVVGDARYASTPEANDVWDFQEDHAGTLWMATTVGPCRLAGESFRCQPIRGGVLDIEADASGGFWLGTPEGLVAFDPRTGTVSATVTGTWGTGVEPGVTTLYREPDSDTLWIGMRHILLRVRVQEGRLVDRPTRVDIPLGTNDWIFDLHRDRRGNLFAATGAGLFRWSSDRFEPVRLPGLPSSPIFSIAEDAKGRLWLGSGHGLVHYAPDVGVVRRYSRADNFLSGELNRRAALLRRNGDLVFGGIEGISQFDPDAVVSAGGMGPVVFTRFSRLTSRGPEERSITGVHHLRVMPGDRAFTIHFAALTYTPGPQRRYRYRIEGLNSSWIEGTEHTATYATPPPGRYVLEVQTTSGGTDSWASPGASLLIDVVPPFWKTAWFRLVLLLAIASLILLAHRWRLRQALLTERVRLRISRDLHDEIGAGLSSIALLSDATGAHREPGGEAALLRRIGDSARTMVTDLRDIVWAIDPDADRTQDVVARMQDVAATLLRDVKIVYSLPPADASGRVGMAVRRDLLLLYKEMLHNVARHSRATEVSISLQMQRGSIDLTVSDNGVGFSPNGSGQGTGLKSLHERARRLGGELHLDTAPGRGTTLRFTRRGT